MAADASTDDSDVRPRAVDSRGLMDRLRRLPNPFVALGNRRLHLVLPQGTEIGLPRAGSATEDVGFFSSRTGATLSRESAASVAISVVEHALDEMGYRDEAGGDPRQEVAEIRGQSGRWRWRESLVVRRVTTLVAGLLLTGTALAQQSLEAPLQSFDVAFAHDTGFVANLSAVPEVVISFTVHVEGAHWLRLHFSSVELAGEWSSETGSILRMTSLRDAEVQELHSRGVEQWQGSSAYFNGDTLLVEVLAQPHQRANRLVMERAVAGLSPIGADFGCGVDTRIPSSDGRVARILPLGCTAFLIADCQSCFLSAGHCVAAGMVAQFNVPLSQTNGTLVHPPIADQFPIDPVSVQSQNAGVGFDWAYFGGLTNNLGETPMQRQRARFVVTDVPPFDPADAIRVNGHGVALGALNQTQQTELGTWTGITTNVVRFTTFVVPGNSGSPVIHGPTGAVLGIVTHDDCGPNNTQNNHATRWIHPNLQAALANPMGVCAGTTCASVGTPFCPTGPSMSVISGSGSSSIASNDLRLHANNVPSNRLGVFFFSRGRQNAAFGVSRLCLGGIGFPVRRLPAINSGAGTTLMLAVDQSALPGGDIFLAGEVILFQAWFRVDATTNETSNGLEVTFGP